MEYSAIYSDIATRTNGDIYIGVVGPVRTGKSTFIKRFMQLMVLPFIENTAFASRARDELPQSAAGRTIMTAEPKFVPEKAVEIQLADGVKFRTRLIDCVGYMVDGALGGDENEKPRMVKSPWFEGEVPFDTAAETGTRKVIAEHSTVGIVVTTDGSIGDIPRQNYVDAEKRVISELTALSKPFVVLLNCVSPESDSAKKLAKTLSEEYAHAVIPVNCTELDESGITEILKALLFEFPLREIALSLPPWVLLLDGENPIKKEIYAALRAFADDTSYMKDLTVKDKNITSPSIKQSRITGIQLGTGCVSMEITLLPQLFYDILSETAHVKVENDAQLLPCIMQLAKIKEKYDKISAALEQAESSGYGVVMPSAEEMRLEEPQVVKQDGRYGVRLKASAPSLHVIKAVINTEIAPVVGSEKQSEELINSLMEKADDDPEKIWQSNIFGKSLQQLVSDGVQTKLLNMPDDARAKMCSTLERVINDGCQGLICIIL